MNDSTTEVFLHADRLFDGVEVLTGVAVGVADGRVTRVLPVESIPTSATVHRWRDATLTPGLIDAHVHLTPWMVFGLLAAGVTTVRDLGNDLDRVIPAIEALAPAPVPRVHWCGPLLEGELVNWPSVARGHDGPDAIRATIAELDARGVRSIKLYFNATPELMAAAADEAHRRGMRVLGHVGATSFGDAVAAGVDELQHLAGCLAADLSLPREQAVAAVAAMSVDHCPTLIVWDAMARLGSPRGDRDTGMQWVHPDAVAAWTAAHHATQPAAERARRTGDLAERLALVPHLAEAGRGVLVGSDAPFPGLIPGFSLHDEAGLLVQSGLEPVAVLRALTSGNADLIGLSDVGRIVPGAHADLAVFAGDPTTRIADLGGISSTWLAGVEVDRGALATGAADLFGIPVDSAVDDLARLRYIPATVPR